MVAAANDIYRHQGRLPNSMHDWMYKICFYSYFCPCSRLLHKILFSAAVQRCRYDLKRVQVL